MTVPSPAGRLMLGHNAPGLWRVDSFTNADSELADSLGYLVAIADLTIVSDKAALLQTISEALSLPDWFGRNWDALEEGLADWLRADPPALLRTTGLEALVAAAPQPAETLLDILVDSARGGHFSSRRSILVVAAENLELPGVPNLP